ncbi:hypothetical protein XM53_12460 [Roseovarius atlanticus]|uniref:Uncharacterized protein n=1 Tax=Roseovarius atlanticus TaxID=1641875 RepID=A0A0T5NU00_9RHOB|nr:hypothetical protein [Roseovarius atlanticus]KRS12222.1 hypothetical protein XM53_12460 [Roseovarius atlanticus]
MQDTARESRLFAIVLLLAVGMVVFRAVATGLTPVDTLAVSDNDDIMRFLMVRDWLAGQGWYDTVQYRMLPPEGLEMHWSRYVDLGIAAVIWPLSLVMADAQAMAVALVVWPTLLFVALIGATGLAARRLFGSMAGLIAVVAVLLWPPTGLTYFAPARIDHHNVQILLTTLMLITVLWPAPRARLGVAGGLAAALSLAVGLETMVTIALAGLVLAGRVVGLRPGAGRQLAGFSLALAGGATLLFMGQTAPAEWLVSRCDELSVPYLALAWVGAGICLAVVVLAPRLSGVALRVGVLVALSVVGLAALSPLIGPCTAGPYDSLPQEVQDLITGRIIEARPALAYLWAANGLGFRFVVPAAMAVLVGSAVWGWQTWRGDGGAARARLGVLLLFGWLGVIGALFQIRLVLMGAAALPMLMGAVVAMLLAAGREGRFGRLGAGPAFVAAGLTLMLPTLYGALTGGGGAGAAMTTSDARMVDADACRKPDLLRSLNTVPEGVILSSSSYGPPLLLLTHHAALAGPYHRSADAIANGAVPFDGNAAVLRAALARTGADYLLLCRDARYGDGTSFATRLAAGERAEGLVPVAGPDAALVLLQVVR